MVVAAGAVLGGKYRLIAEIGRGGMGTVWSAKRIDLDAVVAVKLMKGDVPAKPEALERFRREARSAAALRGPHVVQILDYGVDEASALPFITMELLEGESLRERLDAAQRLTAAQTANIISQIARGLSRAHAAGIIHRDLKPENVFLVSNEDTELVKLLDFGIAKAELVSGEFATATGTVIGTPHYMSPEQVEPARSVDYRTDIWSLGVISAECLLGQRPFEADTLQELAMKICLGRSHLPSAVCPVPVGFDAFFAKACAVDPERRFQSAAALARALSDVCTNELMTSRRAGAAELGATVRLESSGTTMGNLARSADGPTNVRSRSRRRRWLLGSVAALGFVLALVGGVRALTTRLHAPDTLEASPSAAPSSSAARESAPNGAPSGTVAREPVPNDAPAGTAGVSASQALAPEPQGTPAATSALPAGTPAATAATAATAAPLPGPPPVPPEAHELLPKPEPPPTATQSGGPRRAREPRRTPGPPKSIDPFDLQ